MKKLLGTTSLFVLLVLVPGCGTDEREQLILSALDEIGKAGGNMSAIKGNVVNWEKAKAGDKAKLLKNAIDGTTALSKNAYVFQAIKARADKLEAATPDTRKEYVDKYRDRFASAIENVNKERLALNKAIEQAEKTDKAQLADLKSSLQKAQGDFENLVKQR